MTCSNCSSEAIYALTSERVSAVYYCGRHLPPYLRVSAAKGQLTLPKVEVTPSAKKKAKSEPEPTPEPEIIEEPIVEEPIIEAEPVEEAPAVEGSENTEA